MGDKQHGHGCSSESEAKYVKQKRNADMKAISDKSGESHFRGATEEEPVSLRSVVITPL